MKTKNRMGMSALISHPEQKTIEQQLEIFADVGFESFFLSCGVTEQYDRIPDWSKYAKNLNICFEAVHAPSHMVDYVWSECNETEFYRKKTKQIIDYCSIAEISKLVLHTGTNSLLRPTQTGLEFWHNLENYAEQKNVSLCYENANTPDLFEAVANNVGGFHGICHDVGHQLCYTPDKDYLSTYGNKIRYTHIHDNFGSGSDLHFLPYDGIFDWKNYFFTMEKIGYDGAFNLELSCLHSCTYRNMSFKEFAELSYHRLKSLMV